MSPTPAQHRADASTPPPPPTLAAPTPRGAAPTPTLSLDAQLAEYRRGKYFAMPIAGTMCWLAAAGAGWLLPARWHVLSLFIATGVIFYVGLLVARFTGEDLLGRSRKTPFFDRVFMCGMGMSLLVFAIAIPFTLEEPTSLPLSLGVLAGLMWLPMSPLLGHWIGAGHAIGRTALVVAAWLLLPEHRFVAVPLAVVAVYLVTLVVLWQRWQVIVSRPA